MPIMWIYCLPIGWAHAASRLSDLRRNFVDTHLESTSCSRPIAEYNRGKAPAGANAKAWSCRCPWTQSIQKTLTERLTASRHHGITACALVCMISLFVLVLFRSGDDRDGCQDVVEKHKRRVLL